MEKITENALKIFPQYPEITVRYNDNNKIINFNMSFEALLWFKENMIYILPAHIEHRLISRALNHWLDEAIHIKNFYVNKFCFKDCYGTNKVFNIVFMAQETGFVVTAIKE